MSNYKLMPEKATPEMEQAAEKYWNDRQFKGLSDDPRTWAGVYQAMYSVMPDLREEPEPCQECGGDGAGGEHEEDCVMAQTAEQKQPYRQVSHASPTDEALNLFINKVEKIAMSMEAPNTYTPQLMEACIAMRAALAHRQPPPNDPLGGLEYRADGEANFYTLSRPTGNWVARIQFNGELHVQEQERILNAMLRDRNVCYGDAHHQLRQIFYGLNVRSDPPLQHVVVKERDMSDTMHTLLKYGRIGRFLCWLLYGHCWDKTNSRQPMSREMNRCKFCGKEVAGPE